MFGLAFRLFSSKWIVIAVLEKGTEIYYLRLIFTKGMRRPVGWYLSGKFVFWFGGRSSTDNARKSARGFGNFENLTHWTGVSWMPLVNAVMFMASLYCQKSSSFLNLLKIPHYRSRYSYNWSSFPYRVFSFTLFLSRCSYNRFSFQYKVFSFTLSLLRSRRKIDEIKQSRRKLDEIH